MLGAVAVAVFIVLLILKLTGVASELSWWWVWSPAIAYVGIIVAVVGFLKFVFFPSPLVQRMRDMFARLF